MRRHASLRFERDANRAGFAFAQNWEFSEPRSLLRVPSENCSLEWRIGPHLQGSGHPRQRHRCRDLWPQPYLVMDTGASIAPYNHIELGQPLFTEYVWGRQVGEHTINP